MTREIACNDDGEEDVAATVAALNARGFDPGDEDSLLYGALQLRRLANNRRFLADLALAELKDGWRGQASRSGYSAQALLLHGGRDYAIRAAFWPGARDAVLADSGRSAFNLDVAHDHDFHFLTVGYAGPGYWSDYWEYDHHGLTGHVGEPVALRPLGRQRLSPGRLLHYRAHRDVHRQLPGDAFSVSLNILHRAPDQHWRDQYRFDVEAGRIAGRLGGNPAGALLRLSLAMDIGEARDLAECFATGHPSGRMRLAAIQALAADQDIISRAKIYSAAQHNNDPLVRAETARELARIEELPMS